MSIKKPSAVDSPYATTTATTPTVLNSAPGVQKVIQTVQTAAQIAASQATIDATVGVANRSYYANGQAAIDSLVTTSRTGVFAGSNVTLGLTEENYITYNQNYTGSGTVGGANGQVQFNDNGNFGGSANLTFDGANLTVGSKVTAGQVSAVGNVAGNYFIGNGSQLTGLSATYGNANVVANLAALGSNPVSTTGNITSGNLLTSGVVSAAGNVRGSNINTVGGVFSNSITLKNTDDFAQIVFSSDGGATNNGQIKVDGGTNMVVSAASNYYVKQAGSDRLAITNTDTNLMASTNVVIQSNKSGTANTWTFGNNGNLTLPSNTSSINYANGDPYGGSGGNANTGNFTFDADDMLMPLVAKLNSGGISVTNAAEFGTNVTVDGNSVINSSQIYISAGTGEGRFIVNSDGNTLGYYGVENPGFAGMISSDPGVTSEYAIQVGANNQIEIGAVVGSITTPDYVTGIGVLNNTGNINGLFANANVAVIGVGDLGWSFDSTGNLVLPGNTTVSALGGNLKINPIRSSTLNNYSQDTGNVLYYNTTTHEVTAAPANNITGDPFAANIYDSTSNVTVWTASSDEVVGAKLTVRVVYASSGWTNTEMLDIMMAKNYPDGTPAFTVSNRVKTNPAYSDTLIDVTLTGGNVLQVISSAPSGAGNNVYWTCSATSFNQTFD